MELIDLILVTSRNKEEEKKKNIICNYITYHKHMNISKTIQTKQTPPTLCM